VLKRTTCGCRPWLRSSACGSSSPLRAGIQLEVPKQ
jgi:hypothetical protein